MTRVTGLDLSLTASGIARIDDETVTTWLRGTKPAGDALVARAERLTGLAGLIASDCAGSDLVVVERSYARVNGPGGALTPPVPARTWMRGPHMAKRTCTVDGCDTYRVGFGYCNKHYLRFKRYGDPLGGQTFRGEPARWLATELLNPGSECIDWPYGCAQDGRGVINIGGNTTQVSHVVLEQAGFPRPPAPKNHALHSCDRPICVNPNHLRWGGDAENSRDRMVRGRHVAIKGEAQGNAKLTDSAVRDIRASYAKGIVTYKMLAERYGVTPEAIAHVVQGRAWKHVQ